MSRKDILKLFVAIGICELAGVIGAAFTVSVIPTWYAGLAKPALNPPSWIFGPVWTMLYALMGISAFLIWRRGLQQRNIRTALIIFDVQLFLNAIWSVLFFGMRNPGAALLDIFLLWATIIWTIAVFHKISRPAAYILAPYLLWVSFAIYLNVEIWRLN
ncbi:tryptophan-rich sensory protein [Candidatus Uhrbacteria bacterium]|nr:tryptophan-rich sensory protein [Candidatus Uhrbacteria bacterium]